MSENAEPGLVSTMAEPHLNVRMWSVLDASIISRTTSGCDGEFMRVISGAQRSTSMTSQKRKYPAAHDASGGQSPPGRRARVGDA